MFSNDRSSYRSTFIEAWHKATNRQPLEPLETQIVSVIRMHPEYQPLLEAGEDSLDRDFLPDGGQVNPFLHMGLHMAILEQVQLDRPSGIRARYQELTRSLGDQHQSEHALMNCLAEQLWQSQRDGADFDESAYLQCIARADSRRR